MNLTFNKATTNDTEKIFTLVQKTIRTVYPKYYPPKVVDFFCEHHKIENILADVQSGLVRNLLCDGQFVGTATIIQDHITRVFVLPEFQGQGFGRFLMQKAEDEISKNYDSAKLDASLAASIFYEHLGYKTITHGKEICGDEVLVYEIMEKQL